MNIDIHHHAVPDTLFAFIKENQKAAHKEYRTEKGKEYLVYTDNGFVQPIYPVYYDNAARFAMMDEMELDMAVLSISPAHFNYELDPVFATETSRIINDWVGEKQREYPERYRGMMTLPMQDPRAALDELVRAHSRYQLKGLEIASSIGHSNLDDERFFPIYEYCAGNGITICLHPYFPTTDSAFARYYTTNLVRFPLQTCLGLTHMLFGGVLEKWPALNVVGFHGGGHFPYQFGRLMHGYQVRGETRERISSAPDSFLPQIYYDTITHAKATLQFLVDAYGSDHVLIGTDMPYDMGDAHPADTLRELRLTAKESADISSANAGRLFGITS